MRNGTVVDTAGPMEPDVRNACRPMFIKLETAEGYLASLATFTWVVALGAAQFRIALLMVKFELSILAF